MRRTIFAPWLIRQQCCDIRSCACCWNSVSRAPIGVCSVHVSQRAPMHAPVADAHRSAWSSSCCRTSTGCAPDDGAEAVAKRFQQFLDANGKTLQQQGAADADLNAVLDFFAASRASASGPGDATAMAGACEPGASQAIAWHSQLCTLVC